MILNNLKSHNNAPITLTAELNALYLWKNTAENLIASYSTGTVDYTLCNIFLLKAGGILKLVQIIFLAMDKYNVGSLRTTLLLQITNTAIPNHHYGKSTSIFHDLCKEEIHMELPNITIVGL